MSRSASFWIEHLRLSKHIEGGYFNEVYKSASLVPPSQLPEHFNAASPRHYFTHIYFLLEKGQFSALHRIKSDELWHFYDGDPIIIYEIEASGKLIKHLLGNDPLKKQTLFTVVKAGSWFGAALEERSEFALVGCTVSPGFDYDDFEMGGREEMLRLFPQYQEIVEKLTS